MIHGGSGVGSANADVVQAAVVAEGDLALSVDSVVSDALVGSCGGPGRGGFGPGLVGRGGGSPVQGSVGAGVVVLVAPGVEQGLQLSNGGGLGLFA